MSQTKNFKFHVQYTAKDLWIFSMYNSYKGHLGVFNAIFTFAALYLLITQWSEAPAVYVFIMAMCVMMFTFWQPAILFYKARKQAAKPGMQVPIDITCSESGVLIAQGELENKVSWNQVVQVAYVKGEIILYMDKIRAYLLPEKVVGEQKVELFELFRQVLPKERLKRI